VPQPCQTRRSVTVNSGDERVPTCQVAPLTELQVTGKTPSLSPKAGVKPGRGAAKSLWTDHRPGAFDIYF
jgi:hypothetical protein